MRDISMHIMDIVGNSVRAGAKQVIISIDEILPEDKLCLAVKDDGCGMDKETIAKAMDPFFTSRTTRKVGLGIPLLQQNAELTGGELKIESEKGEGTEICANFVRSHIDRPPLGDIAEAISLIMSGNPQVEFIYKHIYNTEEFRLSTEEVKEVLDGIKITEPSVIKFIKQMITENLIEIGVEL